MTETATTSEWPGSSAPEHVLTARMFGAFEVRLEGRPVQRWRAGRTRNLAQYLLVNLDKRVTCRQLHEVLWPETTRERGTSSLKVACHGLRTALGASRGGTGPIRLRYVDFGYILQVDDIWTDVVEFKRLIEAGLQEERIGRTRTARRDLEAAMQLYTGDFLEGETAGWVIAHREYLKSLALLAVQALRRIAELDDDALAVISLCDRTLHLDPYHEPSYRALMGLHGGLGELDRARRWFSLCADRLRQDLGVAPEPATVAAYLKLVGQRSAARMAT